MSDDNVRHEGRPIMKKAIALLVAAMLLTGLSACGGKHYGRCAGQIRWHVKDRDQ